MKYFYSILLLSATLFLSGCDPFGNPEIPNDTELIQWFETNREGCEDILSTVRDFPSPYVVNVRSQETFNPKLVENDVIELKKKLRKIKCDSFRVPFNREGKIHCFDLRTYGMVAGGWYKGIAYLEYQPEQLYSDLNQIPKDSESMEFLLKEIKDGWYIFLQWGG